ncbi:MAG TPA: thioredoxin-disulfide reductase [Thermotogota bacterium]|nr:thioredoxin-disulfide reductase [Thermotogota bacterium]HPJ89173.1 thioredoxin-disulfide reductase [Thermotogota bacterium]HPR95664.1 thioredoxin-disulfide reductase [Thermotogota bacterium]
MVFFDLGGSGAGDSTLDNSYDMIIIGGGPAGLTAAIYAARGGLKTLVLEKSTEGGQITVTQKVENYPGFISIEGMELAERLAEHARHFGADISTNGVANLSFCCDKKSVTLENGRQIDAKTLLIATGAKHRRLGVPGESTFDGKGVSYCAVCDGAFFANKHVAVIGGGNSAIEEGLYLAQLAEKVTVIHRRDQLRADKILQDRAFENQKMEFIWDTVVEKIEGDKFVSNLVLKNVKDGSKEDLPVDGIFIYIGLVPNSDLFRNLLKMTPEGFIITDHKSLETSMPGVYAAGDVIDKELRQIINAAADGATAVSSAIKTYF